MGIFLKDINLKGKTALITGATKGLGRGAAEAIAEAGGNIIAIGRNQSELNSLGKKINFLIQINISKENTKSGININDLDAILDGIDPNDDFVCFRGIMAIPSNTTNINLLKTEFSLLNKAFISMKERFHTVDTLSMGMSNDYLLAMNHGSTMIRVGSKIFGERI